MSLVASKQTSRFSGSHAVTTHLSLSKLSRKSLVVVPSWKAPITVFLEITGNPIHARGGIRLAINAPKFTESYSIYDTMEKKDCYFFVDPDQNVPENEKTMKVLCVECRDQHMPDTGWFYPGSTEGYGPYDYQCSECENFIHKANDDDDDDDQEEGEHV